MIKLIFLFFMLLIIPSTFAEDEREQLKVLEREKLLLDSQIELLKKQANYVEIQVQLQEKEALLKKMHKPMLYFIVAAIFNFDNKIYSVHLKYSNNTSYYKKVGESMPYNPSEIILQITKDRLITSQTIYAQYIQYPVIR